jgi:hypothetical protein
LRAAVDRCAGRRGRRAQRGRLALRRNAGQGDRPDRWRRPRVGGRWNGAVPAGPASTLSKRR